MDSKYTYLKTEENSKEYLLFLTYFFYILLSASFSVYMYIALGFYITLLVFSLRKPLVATAVFRDRKLWFHVIYSTMVLTEGLFVGGIVFTLKQFFTSFLFYSFFVIYHYFENPANLNVRKKVIDYSFAIFMFYVVYSIIYYLLNPGAARRARDHELLLGGGYGLACACALLFVFLFGYLVSGHLKGKPKEKRITIVSLVLMGVLIVLTQSTLTMLIWIVGVISCLYFRRNNIRFYYFRIAILPFILAILIFIFPLIGDVFIDLSEHRIADSRMYERIYSLGHFMKYGNDNPSASYTVNRFSTPLQSITTFINNPIFGVAYKHGSAFLHPSLFGVGNHCEFFDAFANYGVLGGLPFIMVYFLQIAEIFKRKISHPSRAWVWVVVLLGCFNPLRYFCFNFILFFFIPIITKHIEDSLNN